MDLHKLRIFATIARTGNFTRAAELLYMTQPTASQQLAQLEKEVGSKLIERDTRQLRLTPAGEALLPYAEQMMALADSALESARAAAGLADQTLRLGVGHLFAVYLLPGLLSRYRILFPVRRVRISVGNTAELLEMIASGQTEIALVGSPTEREGVEVIPFMQDRLVVIVSPEDRWAHAPDIRVEELSERTLLTREPGSALHAAVEQLLGPQSLSSNDVILLGETEAIKRCVEAGLGVAVVQGMAIEREAAAGTLKTLRLRDVEDMRTYSYAVRSGKTKSSAATDLIRLLSDIPRERDGATFTKSGT